MIADDIQVPIVWKRFSFCEGWRLQSSKGGFLPEHVLQGGVGDCWFLSAVAVVAERRDLISRVICLNDSTFEKDGKSAFKLFIDGSWQTIFVDNYLPCLLTNTRRSRTNSPMKKMKKATDNNGTRLAYAKTFKSQLWVPFLEKAYAKAHGSYAAISGGYIREALLDLTGAPCEEINFSSPAFDSEETWIRLQSFHEAGAF